MRCGSRAYRSATSSRSTAWDGASTRSSPATPPAAWSATKLPQRPLSVHAIGARVQPDLDDRHVACDRATVVAGRPGPSSETRRCSAARYQSLRLGAVVLTDRQPDAPAAAPPLSDHESSSWIAAKNSAPTTNASVSPTPRCKASRSPAALMIRAMWLLVISARDYRTLIPNLRADPEAIPLAGSAAIL
jgi:hypothetical protein